MNTVRKCMTITKTNKEFVEQVAQQNGIRSFSKTVNNILDEKREQNESKINNSSKNSI